MGRFEAFSMGDVSRGSLTGLAAYLGKDLPDFSHVCASSSLAEAMLTSGLGAVSVGTLMDGLVYTDPSLRYRLNIQDYPDFILEKQKSLEHLMAANAGWGSRVRGARFVVQQNAIHKFREYMRITGIEIDEFRMLEASSQQLLKSIQALMSAGMTPSDVSSLNPTTLRAREIWQHLLNEVEDFDAVSRSLWVDPEELQQGHTNRSRELGERLRKLLRRSFGDGPWQIMHHGFYFYTAPQWAFFQLLRACDDVDQFFVVHDDGSNQVFGTWRQFFNGSWDMPVPASVDVGGRRTELGDEFERALGGLSVRTDLISGRAQIQEFRNATELMMHLDGSEERLYAADAESIKRVSRAFGSSRSTDKMKLAQLPIGVFLRSIHGAVYSGDAGTVRVDLSTERFMDIVTSGFVSIPSVDWQDARTVEAVRVAMPYFASCRSVAEWRVNADSLRRLVLGPSAIFGARQDDGPLADRMTVALRNPLRTAPWMDLTEHEVNLVHRTVQAVTNRLLQLADPQGQRIRDHLRIIGTELDKGLSVLTPDEQGQVLDRLRWAAESDDFEPFAEDLRDVVALITGHRVGFDLTGDPEVEYGEISELRNLDVLGFVESPVSIHLTNLSDASFPVSLGSERWPFSMDDIVVDKSSRQANSRGIMECRATNSMASDLYLFWLALNGVRGENILRLSYVSNLDGGVTNLSPFVKLLAAPDWNGAEAVGLVIGGIEVSDSESTADEGLQGGGPKPSSGDAAGDVGEALALLPGLALASAMYCPRRTALQWIVGSSASFQSQHQWQILIANVRSVIYQSLSGDSSLFSGIWHTSRDLVQAVWRNLAPPAWQSSYSNRRVQTGKARPVWILTLGGNKEPTYKAPVDLAYQLALSGNIPSTQDVLGIGDGFLPDRNDTSRDICSMCPVRNRCAIWENKEEAKED